jgi:hypothetical protein
MHETGHGSEAVSHTHVFKKFKRFSEGCKEFEDDPRSGGRQLLEIYE